MAIPASSFLCKVYTMLLAGAQFHYILNPKGTCYDCCEINEKNDIKFILHTTSLYDYKHLYVNDKVGLSKSNFNFNLPTVIYMHGFTESANTRGESSQEVKNAFIRTGRYNVILIDWSALVAAPWYRNAADNVPKAGRYIARFIRFLIKQGYPVKSFHLIGFSLGAELAGFIGNQLQEWSIFLPRITGLDPALPFFGVGNPNRRLFSSSAQFVDVIHTDGGILGSCEPMGHADFYPNGGNGLQPGCIRQEILNNNWLGIFIGCSHRRAWQYFIESVAHPNAFPASCVGLCSGGMPYMGLAADKSLRGSLSLETNGASPFGRGVRAVDINSVTTEDEADDVGDENKQTNKMTKQTK